MRVSRIIAAVCVAGAMAVPAHGEDAPKRVVSMNLCTDQLAMLVAGQDQLVSVSALATDPRGSAMAEQAKGYRPNNGLAEEIYLMQPDLVLVGSFSTPATVNMLERLGIPVAKFKPANSLTDVRDRLAQMGEVLGQKARAAALIADFDRGLSAVTDTVADRPGAALYYANSYTSGDRTLAGQILIAAGFENLAAEAGYAVGGTLPLEVLALLSPQVLIAGRRYPGVSRSEEILDHPVVETLRSGRASGTVTDRDWVCGTPFVLDAIDRLVALRQDMGRD